MRRTLSWVGTSLAVAGILIPTVAAALTPTPTPTRSPALIPCTGDCDQSGSVTLGEIVTCVNIALGIASTLTCPACDANRDGAVAINELQTAVAAALSTCGSDPFEPDDSPQQARTIQCGTSQRHALASPDPADWMILSLDGLSNVVISTSGLDGDPFMRLTDNLLAEIASSDDYIDLFPRIERRCGENALPAGDYYIEISPLSPASQYDIQVFCAPCSVQNPTVTPTPGVDIYEPDNTLETAQSIACGDVQIHSFTAYYDDDWATFTLAERSTVHILASAPFQQYVSMDLHTTDDTILEYGYGNLQRDCGIDALEPGTYAVHTSGYGLAEYNLALLCSPCAIPNPTNTPTPTLFPTVTPIPPDPFEDDSARAHAVPIGCGEGASRSFAPLGDEDWLALDVPERSAVTIQGYGPSIYVALQDDRGRDLAYEYGSIVRACGVDALDSGRYFIELYPPYPTTFTYDVLVTCAPCDVANPPTMAPPTRTPTLTPLAKDRFEPDDQPADASQISCGSLQPHSLDTQFDQDWVTFTLAGDSAVSVSSSAYLELTLLDQSGGVLFDQYRNLDVTCSQPLRAGSYFLRAQCQFCGEGPIAAYNLSLLCGPCDLPATPTSTPTPTATPPR